MAPPPIRSSILPFVISAPFLFCIGSATAVGLPWEICVPNQSHSAHHQGPKEEGNQEEIHQLDTGPELEKNKQRKLNQMKKINSQSLSLTFQLASMTSTYSARSFWLSSAMVWPWAVPRMMRKVPLKSGANPSWSMLTLTTVDLRGAKWTPTIRSMVRYHVRITGAWGSSFFNLKMS